MSGLLGSLHAAKSGMTVSQTSIQTTSHNINNMNTPGYSRQRVEQSAKSAYSYPGYNSSMGAGQLGTGVQATDVIRIRNTFYDFQFRNESHNSGNINVKYEYYTGMESIFNEPSETSISASIANFFSSWQELTKNPTDLASKDIVIQNSKYLAGNISNIKEKLDILSEQAEIKVKEDVEEINKMLDQLKDLDTHINIVQGSGKSPNDLMDERDRILDELSFKMNINNDVIKSGLEDGTLSIAYDETNKIINIAHGDPVTTVPLYDVSGELQGSIDMINKINEYTTSLTDLANIIATKVNEIVNRDGNGKDLFVFNTKTPPNNNPILTVDAPKEWAITTEIASQVYNLKDTNIPIGSGSTTITTTIDKFYNNIIQKLGNETQEVIRNESNQSKILKEIDNSRLNLSGVSLDEEMVNLIQFQHAYNASAKVISTIDSLLEVVINGLKR